MPPDSEGFPRRLDALMKAQGLSTHDVSDRTNPRVSHSAIAQWINGTNKASFEKAKVVAVALGWDPMELFYGTPPADAVDRLIEMEATARAMKRTMERFVLTAFSEGVLEPKEVAKLADAKPLPSRKDARGE